MCWPAHAPGSPSFLFVWPALGKYCFICGPCRFSASPSTALRSMDNKLFEEAQLQTTLLLYCLRVVSPKNTILMYLFNSKNNGRVCDAACRGFGMPGALSKLGQGAKLASFLVLAPSSSPPPTGNDAAETDQGRAKTLARLNDGAGFLHNPN